MGGEDDVKELFQSPGFVDHHQNKDTQGDHQWTNMEDDETSACESSSSSMEDSPTSDMVDDASSNSNGPLYELSQLMSQLPIKRGLSKYFQGKSQSFTCMSGVRNIQQFAKKERHYKKKMKEHGSGLKLYSLPRPTICKKISRNSMPAALCFASCRPPLFPVQTENLSTL
ncbi:hypothetical protein V6N13_104991 [Hibiscus sabdariffa]|uniref:Oxidative stress 3 n=1 Tax=Hibiscus sabdariffa TaxID=183260 RepID=A0ABR2SJ15_9ROSI